MKSNSFNKTKKTRRNKTTPMRRLTRKNNSRVYSKNDYRSGDGMLTATWGPPMWHYLHTMSFNYPVEPTQEDKKHYMDFVLNLQNVLPCKYCRMNLKTNLKELPLTVKCMKNRDSFSRYIYELHELVNKMLKKKSNLKYCDVRERYEHFRSRCTEENAKVFTSKEIKKITRKNGEKGCTEPLYGKKSRCIIKIVPKEEKGDTFQMDKKCIKVKKLE